MVMPGGGKVRVYHRFYPPRWNIVSHFGCGFPRMRLDIGEFGPLQIFSIIFSFCPFTIALGFPYRILSAMPFAPPPSVETNEMEKGNSNSLLRFSIILPLTVCTPVSAKSSYPWTIQPSQQQ